MVSRYQGRRATISDLIREGCSRASNCGCETEKRDCLESVGELTVIRDEVGEIDISLVQGYVFTYRLMSDSDRWSEFFY